MSELLFPNARSTPTVHVYMGDRGEFTDFACRLHGEGVVPFATFTNPLPHSNALVPTVKTGTTVAGAPGQFGEALQTQFKPLVGTVTWPDMTAPGAVEGANAMLPAELKSVNPVGILLRPAPKPCAIKSST